MKTTIIAHRGESYDAPENTLASIKLAWERGVKAVEIDVHLSSDNQVVVIHDPTTKRIGDFDQKVKRQSLAELKRLDVGSWKSKLFRDERIPTLKEVLRTIPKEKKLIIEIKSKSKIIPFLKQELDTSNLKNSQIEIISFNYDVVKGAKIQLPEQKVLYLVDLDYTWMTKVFSPPVEKLIEKVKLANLDGLNVWAGKLLTEKFVLKVKWEKLLLYVWTVDDIGLARKLADWGIDGITTNRAKWLSDQLN